MAEASVSGPRAPSEPLAWPEICRRYPDRWVALVDIDWIDDTDEFRTARVAGHGTTRAAPLAQARALPTRYEEIGHFFTGRVRAPAHPLLVP